MIETELQEELENYLFANNWNTGQLCECGNVFYSKMNRNNCGSYSCEGGYHFLSKLARKKHIVVDNLLEITKIFFKDRGYLIRDGQQIVNNTGNTFFVVAGVQLLDNVILNDDKIPENPFFVAQPVIRTQFLEQIGKTEGISTSFVNMCTEEVNPSLSHHIRNLDTWIDYLSHIGLFAGDITLLVKYKTEDWGTGPFKKIGVYFDYDGLQLGDASFYYGIPQKRRTNITISDIGFGLERICWALNKSPSYFDSFGVLDSLLRGDRSQIDLIRTLTLMAGCGVSSSNKDQGYRFRQFAKKYVELVRNVEVNDLTDHFYAFWNSIVPLKRGLESSRGVIQKELNRSYNLAISDEFGLKVAASSLRQNPNEFLDYLSKRGVSIHSLYDRFKSFKI